jgi:mono/diheme cytochrome c family protein
MRPQALFMAAIFAAAATLSAGAPAATTPVDVSAALSDLMTRLQLQHAKLWFAGKLSNWSLASYEIQRIEVNLEATGKLLPDPSRMAPAKDQLQAVRQAIQQKDVAAFTKAYSALTNECNTCHRVSGYAAITIQVPVRPPVTNQLFVDQVAEGRALTHASCGACHIVEDAAKEAPASRPPAPSFLDIINRPSFSADNVRQFLTSSHRRLGPDQAMPNPRLAEYQIDEIVAYLEALRAGLPR